MSKGPWISTPLGCVQGRGVAPVGSWMLVRAGATFLDLTTKLGNAKLCHIPDFVLSTLVVHKCPVSSSLHPIWSLGLVRGFPGVGWRPAVSAKLTLGRETSAGTRRPGCTGHHCRSRTPGRRNLPRLRQKGFATADGCGPNRAGPPAGDHRWRPSVQQRGPHPSPAVPQPAPGCRAVPVGGPCRRQPPQGPPLHLAWRSMAALLAALLIAISVLPCGCRDGRRI